MAGAALATTTFSGGFAATRSPRALVLAMLWSFPLWLAIAAEAWAVTVAFGIEMPFAGTSWLVREVLKGAGDMVVLEPDDAREAVLEAVTEKA